MLANLSVGDCFTLAGGGNSEMICIAGFGGAGAPAETILLVNPTEFAYPAGSTLTFLAHASTTTSQDHAGAHDDPHVCALSGECYDIQEPSKYTLIRVPADEQEPPAFELNADLDTDGVRPCGLFVKRVALSGSWLNDQVVRIRPHTRDVNGSNFAGSEVVTKFSLQLGNSSWMSFTRGDSLRQAALVGQLAVRFVWREQYGEHMEAQSLELSVGGVGHPAVLTISQASHQALNLDMWGMGRMGYSRMGGVLGTDGHSDSIEEPSFECRVAKSSSSRDVSQRQWQSDTPSLPEIASTLKVSWE
jgi:hypothetical protein